MANERDLDRLLREKLKEVQRLSERKYISGYRNNAGDIVLRDTISPQGTFYARTAQNARDKVVIYGNCSVVNVPFIAEFDGNGNLQVKYPDSEISDLQTQGTASTIFAPPAIPNLSQINVGDYQFAPLRVNFDTSGGLSVAVGAGWHVNDYFAGATIDLTSNVPATPGEVRWVVVGIDTETNLLTAINGTPITGTQSDLVAEDIADIVIPTGVMPLGAVALANGQTAIAQGTSWIVDIRRHHAIGGAGYYETVEDNGTPETQRAALNFADNASGGIDFSVTDDAGNDRSTVTAALDINALTEDTAPDAEADFIATYDASATGTRKVRMDRFPTTERVIFVQTADATVANTVTETTLIGSGRGGVTIPANTATIGTSIHLMAGGYLSDSGNPTLNIKALLDSTEVASTGATTLNDASNVGLWIDVTITFRTLGATGTVVASGVFEYDDGTQKNLVKTTTTTVDTTQDLTIDLTATWGTAAMGNTITTQTMSIHRFTPPTATYP